LILRKSSIWNPKRILVRAANWVGDGIMSLPALEALRARLPGTEVVLLVKPWVSEIYWYHPAVSRLIVYDPKTRHRGLSGFQKLIEEIRAERFEAALLFQNAFQAALIAWAARIPVRVGYATDGRAGLLTDAIIRPPASHYGHQAGYYLQLLFRAGLIENPQIPAQVRIQIQQAEKNWAAKQLKAMGLSGPRFLIGLNPGAAFGPAKRWRFDRYADLADRLIGALHADVLIFGSSGERLLAEKIARAMKHTPIVLAGETSMRQLMALLAQCRLVVTNDSGPMHLAAALGLPVVAIFGSTDERATGPLGGRARVVKNEVECSPCGLRRCPIDFRCMEGLSVDQVHHAALSLVKELGVTHERPLAE
jgi:lipopolysaccharide heptosyltransferase II